MKSLRTPVTNDDIASLKPGDMINISGYIYCGRDAVLPRLVSLYEKGKLEEINVDLRGKVIFHTAVSNAGVGPTTSNKLDIESSIAPLSKAGVKIHLGKGAISEETVKALNEHNSIYAVIPPVTALLGSKIEECSVVAFEEEGMEALHLIRVVEFPAIVAAARGQAIYA